MTYRVRVSTMEGETWEVCVRATDEACARRLVRHAAGSLAHVSVAREGRPHCRPLPILRPESSRSLVRV